MYVSHFFLEAVKLCDLTSTMREVRNTPFLRHLVLKGIILPRQARDKRSLGKTQKRVMCFLLIGQQLHDVQRQQLAYAKTVVLSHLYIHKCDLFTKTGSGQTQGNHSKKTTVVSGKLDPTEGAYEETV